jgi:hypothetical protein
MGRNAMTDFAIDYDGKVARAVRKGGLTPALLRASLPDLWCKAYQVMTAGPTDIVQVDEGGIATLFDCAYSAGPRAEQHDRVVAVFGVSRAAHGKRDSSRMQGFLGGGLGEVRGSTMDKGHFASHAQGGGLDINLFPQRTGVNRGWSDEGRVYRAMERYCADNVGTFFFARPIYLDPTWIPHALEYGVLRDGALWVERFPN